jgi:prolyl oligopeptidase
MFGTKVADPYRWLEDGKSPEVQQWAALQDKRTRAKLAAMPDRDGFSKRLTELFYVESMGLPVRRGKRLFFSRRDAGKEKAIFYVREGDKERALLDPTQWAKDGSISLGAAYVSNDGSKIAYKVRPNNSDEAIVRVVDVATGDISSRDIIEGAKYAGLAWTAKGEGFYYVFLPMGPPVAERPGFAELRFHKLGDDPKNDRLVREKTGDPKTFLNVTSSRDGHWLFAVIEHGWNRTDVHYMDLREGAPKWQTLVEGRDARFEVSAHQDTFFMWTDERASNGKVLSGKPGTNIDTWKTAVAERRDATLREASVVGGKLALTYLKDAATVLLQVDLDGKNVKQIALPTIGLASWAGTEGDDISYISFASFTHPTEIFQLSARSATSTSFYRTKISVNPADFEVEQAFAQSKDGTKVPLFVVHKKGLQRDGRAPTILYGYGGFQVAQTPTFMSSIFPWLERGGVYALAILRGGGEYGEAWHRDGMLHKKQNVFDDFIAAAEHLIAQKYTAPSGLVVRGGSNGGLLVGAAITQRPDLFAAGLCGVPLLDMVRYHQFGSGRTWIEEYGSSEKADDFSALFAYSPYHHVTDKVAYPSMLILSADSDDRVDPMHARKFTALLQARSVGGEVLLRIERNSGHGGADMVKANVAKLADEYAFAVTATQSRNAAGGNHAAHSAHVE